VYSQTSDSIPDASPSVSLESESTTTHSFNELPPDFDHCPTYIPTIENPTTEIMDEHKFEEYPVTRLKKNEFVENGRFLCNNADCSRAFDKNRERK
jgi:hypothetical protein